MDSPPDLYLASEPELKRCIKPKPAVFLYCYNFPSIILYWNLIMGIAKDGKFCIEIYIPPLKRKNSESVVDRELGGIKIICF